MAQSQEDRVLNCSGLLGRTLLRPDSILLPPPAAELLFRPSRPDSIETYMLEKNIHTASRGLFRPSRPDSIETDNHLSDAADKTELFRPSRPDSIETVGDHDVIPFRRADCSGLLGRTLLRLYSLTLSGQQKRTNCSGLLGRTLLRHHHARRGLATRCRLFRPSRPDSIETTSLGPSPRPGRTLFRPSRPDSIETL